MCIYTHTHIYEEIIVKILVQCENKSKNPSSNFAQPIYEVRIENGDKSMSKLCSWSHIKLLLTAIVIPSESYGACNTE